MDSSSDFNTRSLLVFKKSRSFTKIAIIFLIGVFVPLAWKTKEDPVLSRMTIRGPDFHNVANGISVLLDENSELSYPSDDCDGQPGEVFLEGEAFFEITPNNNKPFNLSTGEVTSRLTGSAFNVRAYPQDSVVIITAEQGKAEVRYGDQVLGNIASGERIVVNKRSGEFRRELITKNEVPFWRSKYLVFNRISVGAVARILEERYSVTVSLQGEHLKDCIIFAKFLNGEPLEHVIKVISTLVKASYTIDNNLVTIMGKGGPCKPYYTSPR